MSREKQQQKKKISLEIINLEENWKYSIVKDQKTDKHNLTDEI